MMALIIDNMAPLMFVALIAFLLLGYPVAFSLGAVGLVFAVIGIELGLFEPNFLGALPQRIWDVMSNPILLAIPFFTFMGLILERSGMAEDLLETIGQLFGTIRGGLAYAVIFVGALLAATTGIVAASVISMGLISLPIMLRYGYDRRLVSGVIAASGTLAQIIPPSLVLIVLADQLGRSVRSMYDGAFLPGLMLAGLYAVFVFIIAMMKPEVAPGVPKDEIKFREPNGDRGLMSLLFLVVISGGIATLALWERPMNLMDRVILTLSLAITIAFTTALVGRFTEKFTGFRLLSRMAEQVTFVMVPPLFLIFLVLGTIFIGVATETEGGAMGAVGALLLAAFKRRLEGNPARFNFAIVKSAAEQTAKLSAFVIFILIGARIFSLTFYGVDGHKWVEGLLTSLPGGEIGFLIAVNALVFFLAFFLDFFELAFIIVPLLKPAAEALNIDLVWFGVMLAVNMQTSFMHPPFGFALFYLRSVAPKQSYIDRITGRRMEPVTTAQIYWGAVPFVFIQLIMVAIVVTFPGIVRPSQNQPAKPAAHQQVPRNGNAPQPSAPGNAIQIPATPPPIGSWSPPKGSAEGPSLDLSTPPEIKGR